MNEITIFANSKINLGLRIINKREDGFHEIESIFQEISLSDKLVIKKSNNIDFKTNSDELNKTGNNLCVKAAEVLQNEYGIKGMDIFLEKKIPIGSGLGGGSSDAAAVLKCSNLLYNLDIPNQKLKKLAAELGSDIPFFLHGRTAHVSGRGEVIEPINIGLNYYVLLVLPQTKVSTEEAYKSLGLLLTRNDNDFKFKSSNLLNLGVRKFKNIFYNEFEKSIFDKYPNLCEIKNLLYREQAEYASLSGSGSTVYGIYSSPEIAQKAHEKLSKFYRCYVVKPVY